MARKLHAPRPYSQIWTDCGKVIGEEATIADDPDKVDCRTCLHKRRLREERKERFKPIENEWLNT